VCTAQTLNNNSSSHETPNEYYLQVKQFNEFIDRFNYQSDWKGNLIDSSFAANYPRQTYLNYLINLADERLTTAIDSNYMETCNAFISEVTNTTNPQYISLYGGQVIAKALVNITYQGKNQSITIYFAPEVLSDRSAKWVISKVETQCFESMADSLKTYFIAPNSHETSFINLKRLEHLSNPLYFMPTKIAADNAMLFATEVAAKRLTINNIAKVTYLISFPNWLITVEEFNRSNYNSGWLIRNVEEIE
jgi:hypothetical protein